jgi:hypothetical protein
MSKLGMWKAVGWIAAISGCVALAWLGMAMGIQTAERGAIDREIIASFMVMLILVGLLIFWRPRPRQ